MTKIVLGGNKPLPHVKQVSDKAYEYCLAIFDLRAAEKEAESTERYYRAKLLEDAQTHRANAMEIWDTLALQDQQAALDYITSKADEQ